MAALSPPTAHSMSKSSSWSLEVRSSWWISTCSSARRTSSPGGTLFATLSAKARAAGAGAADAADDDDAAIGAARASQPHVCVHAT